MHVGLSWCLMVVYHILVHGGQLFGHMLYPNSSTFTLYYLYCAVGERNGPPQNHPQCAARIYSGLHSWCRSQVNNFTAFLYPHKKCSSVRFTVTFFFFYHILQHTGWCSSVLHHWSPGGSRLPAECWGELWCGGLCRDARSLHTWFCGNWQVNRQSHFSLYSDHSRTTTLLRHLLLHFFFHFAVSKSVKWCSIWLPN